MNSITKKLDILFENCSLGISSRRIWEHTQLRQINPFRQINPTMARHPQDYVDIIDVSSPIITLTGLTVSDLLKGKRRGLSQAHVEQLLEHLEGETVRKWLATLEQHLWKFSQQRAVRNLPDSFLPEDNSSKLGVQGIHCALATWLKVHCNEKATVKQWINRIMNLAQKGLKSDELEFSGMHAALTTKFNDYAEDSDSIITGSDLLNHLSYEHLRFSIIPMVLTADNDHLTFLKVPANAVVKRIKPKLKKRLETHPQWHDRVLGYWVDEVIWDDLLGHQRGWMAFTHRGLPIVSRDNPLGLCRTYDQACALADNHAKNVLPKLTTKGRWSHLRLTGGEQYREWLVTLPNFAQGYFSDHFSHRNVLLHVRCDIREDANGDRVLVLQEVQSDWAQQARRALKSGNHLSRSIPVPPWLQEWPALALKLMLLHAAQQEVSALVWTQGNVQVERYEGLGEAGLLELYDRTLPGVLTKSLQPYGRKCESIEVFQPVNFYIEPADVGYEVWDEDRYLLGKAATWEDAQKLIPDGAQEILKPMHGIRLDEALRQELLKNGFCAWGAGIK